jgi:hypothetical protein
MRAAALIFITAAGLVASGATLLAMIAPGAAFASRSFLPAARPAGVPTIGCDHVLIGVTANGHEVGMRRALGVVSAPRSYLANVGSAPAAAPFVHWTKAGIEIRADAAITVTVARPWQTRVHITWGGVEGAALHFAPCSARTGWNAYAGGFLSRATAVCVPLVFTVGRRRATLLFGIGCRC